MSKFEAHITIAKDHAAFIEREVAPAVGWSFSQIDGDPIMGQQPYCYLTHYSPDGRKLREAAEMVSAILKAHRIPTLRIKVEQILFDTKTGLDELR